MKQKFRVGQFIVLRYENIFSEQGYIEVLKKVIRVYKDSLVLETGIKIDLKTLKVISESLEGFIHSNITDKIRDVSNIRNKLYSRLDKVKYNLSDDDVLKINEILKNYDGI